MMFNFEEIELTHILLFILGVILIYVVFIKPNEQFGELPHYGPIDIISNAYSGVVTPYTFGVPGNTGLCHVINNKNFCKSKVNCKWDNYNGCRYWGENKQIVSNWQ